MIGRADDKGLAECFYRPDKIAGIIKGKCSLYNNVTTIFAALLCFFFDGVDFLEASKIKLKIALVKT
jgi:hypothetical protein